MKDLEVTIYASVVSLWEIAIKRSLGKLDFHLTFHETYRDLAAIQIRIVGITSEHLTQVETLPFHHGDPFDRLLIAQSQVLKADMITRDKVFSDYGVQVIW
ncbi:MAG: type II toxin-antitoxin system VapC family toxin [Tunicatimonas sp.]|uniref:type II toxin-antitoxin system VapC family toxin n=1 Tax=Tunicatimonas sp. TaxID=1940096 RepID=UPI003C74D9D9